jgi:transposase InsO family protein
MTLNTKAAKSLGLTVPRSRASTGLARIGSLDFVADQFIDCRRMRILVVVDDSTRECLTLVADTSISGLRVARELDRLLVERGKPRTIVSDNGTELTSNAILRWTVACKESGLSLAKPETQYVAGRPLWRNATYRAIEQRDSQSAILV